MLFFYAPILTKIGEIYVVNYVILMGNSYFLAIDPENNTLAYMVILLLIVGNFC